MHEMRINLSEESNEDHSLCKSFYDELNYLRHLYGDQRRYC